MVKLGKLFGIPLLLMVAGSSFGQDTGNLHENSPFVPSNFNPKNKAGPKKNTANNNKKPQFEFQGVYQIGENWMFSILNKSTNQSEWVGLNDSTADYQVSHFDPGSNTLSFNYQNTPQEISLRERSDRSIPVILAKSAQPKRRVPVRRKVNPNLPKKPPTAAPTSAPRTPPPNFTPPPLPASIAERRAMARRTAIPSTGSGIDNNSLFNAPTSGGQQGGNVSAPGGLPSGISGPPSGRPPSAPPPGPPPGARPPRSN